jgi:antirestriction protein
MGQPNRDSLSDSQSKKFSWDSQAAIRWAIHSLRNFHGTAKQLFAEQFTVKEIFMGQPNHDSLSDSQSKKFSWDSQTAIRWAIHGQRNFHGTAKPRFAEQFTVKEIFMGQPNCVSLSNSRSKKFSWDSQTAIRWAIHGLRNFHGTAKPRFAEQFTV